MDKLEKKILLNPKQWIQWMNNLPRADDDIGRTRNHYLCRHHYENILFMIIRNTISIFVLIYLEFKLKRYNNDYVMQENYDAVVFAPSKEFEKYLVDIPSALSDKYKKKIIYNKSGLIKEIDRIKLDEEANTLWKQVRKRYPFSFYMNIGILVHLSRARYLIEIYHPKALVSVQTERDYTTSIISQYCEKKGVKYIGFQHGEYFMDLSHAFVRFSEFYVWDSYYIQQFAKTHSPVESFKIYKSQRLIKRLEKKDKEKYFMTYYLSGNETKKELKIIADFMIKIADLNGKCAIRPHPRHTKIEVVRKLIINSNVSIQGNDISIDDSLIETRYITSIMSTVLSEAYCNELEIVIDDISNPKLFTALNDDMYINLNRTKNRLSMFIERNSYK